MSVAHVTQPTKSASSSRAAAAAAVYAIRGIRSYLVAHPELSVRFRPGKPLPIDVSAPTRVQQAQVIEMVAYALSTTNVEFVAFRSALGLIYDGGQTYVSERAADAIDAVEKELN